MRSPSDFVTSLSSHRRGASRGARPSALEHGGVLQGPLFLFIPLPTQCGQV
jgi:hypothetical protein